MIKIKYGKKTILACSEIELEDSSLVALNIKDIFNNENAVPNKVTTLSNIHTYTTNYEHCDTFNIDWLASNKSLTGDNLLVIILESPHKDEYDFTDRELTPKAPALGKTGTMIKKHIQSIAESLKISIPQYIAIVNPVPWQTSLSSLIKKK